MIFTTKLALLFGLATSTLSRMFHKGAGITWSGEIALRIDSDFVKHSAEQIPERILIAGTNGKTTTSAMIAHILLREEYKIVHNKTGANLLNGIAGTLISSRGDISENSVAVFESDEAAFGHIASQVKPTILVLLNLFRDQLDRYGEVDVIADKWSRVLSTLPKDTVVIANGDDPLIVHVTKSFKGTIQYFGIQDPSLSTSSLSHATDSIYCSECGGKLAYDAIYISHLGDWHCTVCENKRPQIRSYKEKAPLVGLYNIYNTYAAFSVAKQFKLSTQSTVRALSTFKPVFGRQETFIRGGKKIQVFLSKNPTGFNENLKTILSLDNAGTLLFVLNDRIADGTDVSWIWDVDFELLNNVSIPVICSGDRANDMVLRIKYSHGDKKETLRVEENLKNAIEYAISKTTEEKVCYILPTYTAMLNARKILTGRKIL
jgi:UDP-N-acetylmuramyl tripeptide synthase